MARTTQEPTSSFAARAFTLVLFLACFAPLIKCQEIAAATRTVADHPTIQGDNKR